MAILGTLGFRTNVELKDVTVKGISSVTREDIAYAKRLGYELKALGIADRIDDEITISVATYDGSTESSDCIGKWCVQRSLCAW